MSYEPSDNDLDSVDGITKMDGCRIESPLQNSDLPILGNDELESSYVANFKCNYNMRSEIELYILDEVKKQDEERSAAR